MRTTLSLFALLAAASAHDGEPERERRGYEIWITDQNNTAGYSAAAPRGTHGGRLIIYENSGSGLPMVSVALDLADVFASGGPNNGTGANVVRPHMLVPSPDGRHVALAFVASGHVAIMDVATRRPKALFRMSAGAGGARQAHAAFWTADGRGIVVANQNGKLLEKIEYDPDADRFTHDAGATLDLANCRTPNGYPCQSATPAEDSDPGYYGPHNRPDNAPICPIVSDDNKVYVTLRGGGLFVVDTETRPMSIVAEYGNQYFGRDGCGGVQARRFMYLNSGAGTPAANPSGYAIYQLRDDFPSAPAAFPPNPAHNLPCVLDIRGGPGRDAHGMVLTARMDFLWQLDRLANTAEVYRIPAGRHIATVDLTAGGLSTDPTPDLAALSPLGDRIYVTLRGPRPQTGAHASQGSTPGLGVITLREGGASGQLTNILRTTLRNPVDGGEESDPHGICVVLRRWDLRG